MTKRHRIAIVSIATVVVLVAVSAVVWFQRAPLTRQMEQQLSAQFGNEFFTGFDLEPVVPAAEETSSRADDATAAALRLPDPSMSSLSQPRLQIRTPVGQRPTTLRTAAVPAHVIMARYELRFVALEKVATERLDALYAAGKDEYSRTRHQGRLHHLGLINKYLQAGRLLEKNIDMAFYNLLAELRQELAQNGHSVERTAAVESEYVSRKNRLRPRFLDRIQSQ
jgi:hypothetical protein